MSHWLYEGKPVTELPENVCGFVYKIKNLTNNKKYIGRKYTQSTTRKPLTKKQKESGRVRRDVVKKESNWKTYTGSNKQLNEDIKRLGKENFSFEILYFAETKGQINYIEMYVQFIYNVVLDDMFYNNTIGSNKFTTIQNKKSLLENIKSFQKFF